MSQREKITEEKAQEIGKAFLLVRYPSAKVKYNKTVPVSEQDTPSYYLEGNIEVRSGSIVAQFIWPPDRYTFKIWVSCLSGRILRWEMN